MTDSTMPVRNRVFDTHLQLTRGVGFNVGLTARLRMAFDAAWDARGTATPSEPEILAGFDEWRRRSPEQWSIVAAYRAGRLDQAAVGVEVDASDPKAQQGAAEGSCADSGDIRCET